MRDNGNVQISSKLFDSVVLAAVSFQTGSEKKYFKLNPPCY